MKLTGKFKRNLVMAMAISTAMTTVYAAPVVQTEVVQEGPSVEVMSGTDTSVSVPKFFGAGTAIVPMGEAFDPLAGVLAYDGNGNDITSSIVVTGTIDVDSPGVYYFTYTATDANGLVGRIQRTVIVDGRTNPHDRLPAKIYGTDAITIELGTEPDLITGVTAIDDVDGDLTNKIKITSFVNKDKPGEYLVIYTVMNTMNMETIVYRTVTVVGEIVEPEPEEKGPAIYGVEDITVNLYGWFSMINGVTAVDGDGNSIMHTLQVEGDFSTVTPGVREIKYTAHDAEGRTATVIKRVTVLNER